MYGELIFIYLTASVELHNKYSEYLTSSIEFVNSVEKLRNFQAIVGIPKNRLMANGKAIETIASWFYLERNGKLEKRFVILDRLDRQFAIFPATNFR